MFLYHAMRGFSRNYKSFGPIYGDLHCGGGKNFRSKYSLPTFKCRPPSQPALRNVSKRAKQGGTGNADRKVYMRDMIRDVSSILRYSSWDSAQEQLKMLHVKWDSFTVNQVLKSHPPMQKAWLFFIWISKQKGYKHDQYTYTTMLDIFGEARRINSMKYVFQMMQENGIKIDVVTYTSILHWLSNSGDFDGAVKVWEEMKGKRCHPTVVSYTAYMKILFDNKRADEAVRVYKEMLQSGLSPTCHTYTVLMVHLISSGKCKSALDIFSKMQETGAQPDKATCNILVEKCSKAGEAWAIIQILQYMKENSLVLRYPIYLLAHRALKMTRQDDMLLRKVNPHIMIDTFDGSVASEQEETALDLNSNLDRGLLISFLRKKNLVAVNHLFAGLVLQNIRLDPELVSEVIEENCAHGRVNAALEVFDCVKNMDIHIGQVAYLSLIGVLIRTNGFSDILQIVQQMVKFDFFLEAHFATSLICRLGHARELDTAIKVFNLLPVELKSMSVYTALISSCFSAGDPDKSIETFVDMKKRGIEGSSGTYNIVIRGLEMCGRVDEAKFYWREKKSLEKKVNVPDNVLMDERICDILFSGGIILTC